jgi:hypothetical protein
MRWVDPLWLWLTWVNQGHWRVVKEGLEYIFYPR